MVSLVGRREELDQLKAALANSLLGQGEVCSLTGEPGIGKTRLASEFVVDAGRRGALTLWGRCARLSAPTGWPWIQISRAYMSSGDEYLAGEMGELVEVFASADQHSDADRFRLFDRVAATFRSLARSRPLILVFDDLQAIDQLSLTLLSFAARDLCEAGALIVIIYQEPEVSMSLAALPQWSALVSEESRHVALRPLTYPETAELILQLAHRKPEPDLVEALGRKTGGNPRLIEAVLSSDLVDWTRRCVERRIPPQVRLAVDHHLTTLSATTKELLTIASVIGTTFDVATAQMVSGRSLEQIVDAMAEGERARVLHRTDPVGGQYQFKIELVRDALCERLAGASRDRLHIEIAQALETLYYRGASVSLEEVAYHFAKGAALGHAHRAVEYARHAASKAMRRGAFHEAARLYALALSAAEFVQNYDEAKRWDLLLALASSQMRCEDLSGARRTYQRALELAERLGDPERAALAALGLDQFTWSMPSAPNRSKSEPSSGEDWEPQVLHAASERPAILDTPGEKRVGPDALVTGARTPPSPTQDARATRSSSVAESIHPGEVPGPQPLTQTNHIPERTFRREGEYWTICYEGRVIRIKHAKGLAYIAHFLAHPGREFHVTELVAFFNGVSGGMVNAKSIDEFSRSDLGDVGPALDATSKSSYRQRLRDLRAELDEAISSGDSGRSERAQEEIEFLSKELARAVGLGGRDRKINSNSERARLRVTNVVRLAMRKIAKEHPALGRYLALSLHTGSLCSFEPDGRFPGIWRI
jgi:AAA ATPase domain